MAEIALQTILHCHWPMEQRHLVSRTALVRDTGCSNDGQSIRFSLVIFFSVLFFFFFFFCPCSIVFVLPAAGPRPTYMGVWIAADR